MLRGAQRSHRYFGIFAHAHERRRQLFQLCHLHSISVCALRSCLAASCCTRYTFFPPSFYQTLFFCCAVLNPLCLSSRAIRALALPLPSFKILIATFAFFSSFCNL